MIAVLLLTLIVLTSNNFDYLTENNIWWDLKWKTNSYLQMKINNVQKLNSKKKLKIFACLNVLKDTILYLIKLRINKTV